MKKNLTLIAIRIAAVALLYSTNSFAQTSNDTLYQALNGKNGIDKIIADFLPIVLSDIRIKDTFKDVDMDQLGQHLAEQFCVLSGGPCKYSGKDMTTIHADLAITNAQFNALAEDLQIAMEKQNVPSSIQNKLIAKLAPMQRDIVTK